MTCYYKVLISKTNWEFSRQSSIEEVVAAVASFFGRLDTLIRLLKIRNDTRNHWERGGRILWRKNGVSSAKASPGWCNSTWKPVIFSRETRSSPKFLFARLLILTNEHIQQNYVKDLSSSTRIASKSDFYKLRRDCNCPGLSFCVQCDLLVTCTDLAVKNCTRTKSNCSTKKGRSRRFHL